MAKIMMIMNEVNWRTELNWWRSETSFFLIIEKPGRQTEYKRKWHLYGGMDIWSKIFIIIKKNRQLWGPTVASHFHSDAPSPVLSLSLLSKPAHPSIHPSFIQSFIFILFFFFFFFRFSSFYLIYFNLACFRQLFNTYRQQWKRNKHIKMCRNTPPERLLGNPGSFFFSLSLSPRIVIIPQLSLPSSSSSVSVHRAWINLL